MDTEGVHARANARPTSIGWGKRVDVGARGGGFFCTRREGVSSRPIAGAAVGRYASGGGFLACGRRWLERLLM